MQFDKEDVQVSAKSVEKWLFCGYFLTKPHTNAEFWPNWCNWVEFFANLAWVFGFGRKRLLFLMFWWFDVGEAQLRYLLMLGAQKLCQAS